MSNWSQNHYTCLCWGTRSNTICDVHKVWSNGGSSPNTKSFPRWCSTPWRLAQLSQLKQVSRDTLRSGFSTCMTELLEDLRTTGESRCKVPAQVPMLPGTRRCSCRTKKGLKCPGRSLPHLSDPHCHGSPSMLSNHILRLDASLNWALCWKRFCYMIVMTFWLIATIKSLLRLSLVLVCCYSSGEKKRYSMLYTSFKNISIKFSRVQTTKQIKRLHTFRLIKRVGIFLL